LFPPVDPVGVDVHLALWAIVVFFSFAQAEGSTLDAQVGGVAGFLCRHRIVFLAGFHFFCFRFLKSDLRMSADFC
jgi:hypothetical protein